MTNKIIKKEAPEEIPKDALNSSLLRLNSKLAHHNISEEEIKHYGILGQKWGIRKAEAAAERSVRKSRAAMLSRKRNMSDEELKAAVKRLELEKKFTDLAKPDIDPGLAFVSDNATKFMSGVIGSVAGAAGAAIVKEVLKNSG